MIPKEEQADSAQQVYKKGEKTMTDKQKMYLKEAKEHLANAYAVLENYWDEAHETEDSKEDMELSSELLHGVEDVIIVIDEVINK